MPDRRIHDRSRPARSGRDGPLDDDPIDGDPFEESGREPDPAEVLARLRPPPPRSWRDRLDEVVAGPPPAGRTAALAIGVVVVALVGWRVLAPAPAPEDDLPVAQPSASETAPAGPATATTLPHGATGSPSAAGAVGQAGSAGVAGGEVVVHVVGAVADPGVQRLPFGARVIDAIDASGGATPDADLARVNLAAVLTDGEQVVVPRPGEIVAPVDGAPTAEGTPGVGDQAAPVNINTASAAELEALPGVGPTTAEAIISHRESAGPFASVDDLLDVRGIGEAKLEQIRDLATV